MTSLQFYKPLWYLQRLQPGRPLLLKEEGREANRQCFDFVDFAQLSQQKKTFLLSIESWPVV